MNFNNFNIIYLCLIAILLWTFNYWKIFKKPQIFLGKNIILKKMFGSRILIFILGLVAWSFITYSAMEPRKVTGRIKDDIRSNDIFIIVDVSRSMLAEDFFPNRLEVAKNKIREFIKLYPTDRIGIIEFAEKAFTLLPLTIDLELIERTISDIKVGFLGSGTNIGDALGLGVGRLSSSPAKNKIVVLLTDGVSNVGNMTPDQAAGEASKKKIRVYTIGIGARENNPVLKTQGRYSRIPGGSVDIKNLKKISQTTGGKFYYASDAASLKNVFSTIQSLEKAKISVNTRVLYKELYWKYLLIGILILMLVELSRKVLLREAL